MNPLYYFIFVEPTIDKDPNLFVFLFGLLILGIVGAAVVEFIAWIRNKYFK